MGMTKYTKAEDFKAVPKDELTAEEQKKIAAVKPKS